jgi:DNA-binding NtrC family response regulator
VGCGVVSIEQYRRICVPDPMGAQFRNVAVLLVDDRVQEAVATRDALQELGCNPVAWATTWEQAERMAARTLPQLFIVDARLHSHEDGIALVRDLRRRYRAPVIFLVEHADTKAVRHAVKIPAATSLVRPYDRTGLAVALAEALKLTTTAYLTSPKGVGDGS